MPCHRCFSCFLVPCHVYIYILKESSLEHFSWISVDSSCNFFKFDPSVRTLKFKQLNSNSTLFQFDGFLRYLPAIKSTHCVQKPIPSQDHFEDQMEENCLRKPKTKPPKNMRKIWCRCRLCIHSQRPDQLYLRCRGGCLAIKMDLGSAVWAFFVFHFWPY